VGKGQGKWAGEAKALDAGRREGIWIDAIGREDKETEDKGEEKREAGFRVSSLY